MIAYIICFVLLVVGLFLAFKITPTSISEDLEKFSNLKPNDIKYMVTKAKKTKKESAFMAFFRETFEIMNYMKATKNFVIILFLSVIALFFSILIANTINPWFIPGLAFLFLSLPFLYVHSIFHKYTRKVMRELEVTLDQVTNSYIRSEKICESVEENLPLINPPVRQAFQEFVAQLKYVDPNEKQAIEDLSEKIDDNIFKEWCDSFKRCAGNRTVKYLLKPSLEKYSTVKELDERIKFDIIGLKTSYWIALALVYSNYILLYFINQDWYSVLADTYQGAIVNGVVFFIAVVCSVVMTFLTKPIKYKI